MGLKNSEEAFVNDLRKLDRWLETPMLWLSFVWLVLLIIELVHGFTPFIFSVGTLIWTLFVLQFILKLFTVDRKLSFLKDYWLLALALTIPILRLLKLQEDIPWIGYLTASSGAQLVWVFCSVNRSMESLRVSMQKRGFSYALVLTIIVVLTSAAGVSYFERHNAPGTGVPVTTYADALWWCLMQLTTIGSAYSPITPGGMIICVALSFYACAMLGYLTAALATFFIGTSAPHPSAPSSNDNSLKGIHEELISLRKEIQALKEKS